MPLTKEQLLIPRYKVKDKYPGMEAEPFRLEQIITLQWHKEVDGDESAEGFIHIPIKHMPRSFMWQSFFDLYSNIFQPLPWWSDRSPEDMPEYVRYSEFYLNHYHLDGEFKNMIFKVNNWSNGHYGIKAHGDGIIHGYEINFEPADESEYNAYINQK